MLAAAPRDAFASTPAAPVAWNAGEGLLTGSNLVPSHAHAKHERSTTVWRMIDGMTVAGVKQN